MTDAVHAQEADDGDGDGSYSGLPGAFWYAFRASDSLLFKLYAAASALLGVLVALLLLFTLAVWFVETLGQSALTTSSNAFLGVIALFILIPLFAPTILTARAHRRGNASKRRDAALALAGFLFVASLYVGLVITVPSEFQADAGPVVSVLYDLPALWGLVPPVLGAALIWLVYQQS